MWKISQISDTDAWCSVSQPRHWSSVRTSNVFMVSPAGPGSYSTGPERILFLDKAKFPASFAADVDPTRAAFMADSQVPWGVAALDGTISEPAWKSKPSGYVVGTEDRMIPPPAQRFMSKRAGSTIVEVKGSHAIYVSQPDAVAALIEKAASDVS